MVPFDEELGVADRERTIAVDRAIVLLGSEMPFQPARGVLEELTGISVSDKTVQEVTEAAGREAMAMLGGEVEAAKTAKLEPAGGVLDWRRDALEPLYIEPDGSMVPMRPEDRPDQKPSEEHPGTHREAKMAVIFRGSDVINVSEKRREVRRKTYVATIGGVQEFRDKLWAATMSVTGARRFQPVILGDGAEWITNLTEDLFPDAIRIVDIFHPLERIHEVARLRYGSKPARACSKEPEDGLNIAKSDGVPETPEAGQADRLTEGGSKIVALSPSPNAHPGRAWARLQKERLKASDIDVVLAELEAVSHEEPFKKGDRQTLREKCQETIEYIKKRRAYMDYATYLAKGLMIGSGIIESSHKRVIGQRLKQAGMHWSLDGANAMVHLRALHLSDGPGWDRLWERLAAAG